MVWDNQGKGWDTVCNSTTCDWKIVRDLGPGSQTTSLGVSGATIYAGWCGNGCNPGGAQPFKSGIDTNFGGTWHRVDVPNLPNRIPTSFWVDPADDAHVVVTYGAFSRRWIPGGGVGHVFESHDGGATWADRSGDLPDAPVNDVVVNAGQLYVGTDVGVFATSAANPGVWSRVGTNLPNASTNDLVVAPGRTTSSPPPTAAASGRSQRRADGPTSSVHRADQPPVAAGVISGKSRIFSRTFSSTGHPSR